MNAYETQVWLYDLSGRLVEAKAVRDREGSIDISKMKSGLNLLKISFGNDSIHYEKVVTQ